MLRLAADENLDIRIDRGLKGQAPELDIVRVQDAGLKGAEDPVQELVKVVGGLEGLERVMQEADGATRRLRFGVSAEG